ncbi:MAG: hypothetical protein V2A56_06095 [bacterium]
MFRVQDASDQQERCECPACGMDAYILRPVTYTLLENEDTDNIPVNSASAAV